MKTFTLGVAADTREFTREHIRRLHQWFDAAGHFRQPGTPPSSRERLWNCCSLLEGDAAAVRLANAIIVRTPIDANHFLPISAAEVLLRFPSKLTPAARGHLLAMVRRHYLLLFEWRYGTEGMHNFVCMTTWFLLAAARLLEQFEFDHEFAAIPEVYSRERMWDIGQNALRLLDYEWEHRPVSTEFNSPTYSPISVMALAKIAELIPDRQTQATARRLEAQHWRELLGMYHPRLSLPGGPFSREYRVDMLGQVSCMRMLMCYLGLSGDRSLAGLFDESQPDLLLHHAGDVPFNWAQAAWLASTRYHLPADALAAFRRRRFPHRYRSATAWGSSGVIDRKQKKLISVHGNVLPGGTADLVQIQHRRWAVGWRSYTAGGHTFPIHLHYALREPVGSLRDVRTVTTGVMFQSEPLEWTKDQRGQPIECDNFNHYGHLRVKEVRGALTFEGRPLESLAPLPTTEVSINTFLPTHFDPPIEVRLNGRRYTGAAIEQRVRAATLEVNDHGFRFRVEYRFARPVVVRLWRWAKFLRLAGIFHEGRARRWSPAQLAACRVRGVLRVAG